MKTKNATKKHNSPAKGPLPPVVIELEMELYSVANAAQERANELINAQFLAEVEKVVDWASAHDLILLTEAIRHWYAFHGEDRMQSGNLVASILHKCGVRSTSLEDMPTGEVAA